MSTFLKGHKNDALANNVAVRPPKDLLEMQQRCEDFIRLEEACMARKGITEPIQKRKERDKEEEEKNSSKDIIQYPWKLKNWGKKQKDLFKHCRFHRNHGNDTDNCRALEEEIEDMIQHGYLRHHIKDENRSETERAWKDLKESAKKPSLERINMITMVFYDKVPTRS